MEFRRLESSPDDELASPVPGGDRAPKRRRLNNGEAAQALLTGPSDTGILSAIDRDWPAREELPAIRSEVTSSIQRRSSLNAILHGNSLSNSGLGRSLSSDAFETPVSEQETLFGLLENNTSATEPPPGLSSNLPPASGEVSPSNGGWGSTFGALRDPHYRVADSREDDNVSRRSSQRQVISEMDGLEAIDLTAVNDGTSLREREQLDDESRRVRREASARFEARRKANAQMMKSTLEQQQEESANASGLSNDKGLGSLQCVICMDSFTDITATHCGHVFCHTCINEHLITAEMSRGYPTAKPLCPFCRSPVFRKPIRKNDKEKGIVPLLFKVRHRYSGHDEKQSRVERVD